jgi:hypothetical protein
MYEILKDIQKKKDFKDPVKLGTSGDFCGPLKTVLPQDKFAIFGGDE